MTPLTPVVSSAMHAKAGTNHVKASGENGADWFALNAASSFGSQFASIFNTGTSNAASQASTNADPTAQLIALLQNGTPISTIVKQIAQNVSDSVAQQYSGKLPQSQIDSLRSSLVQSITNALSPPSNAPPGTAAEQVAALAARLQSLISAIARDTKTTTGQQNELSGQLLDADSAKEIPAQQKTKDASSSLDVSSLVRSLLANAAAALTSTPATKPAASKAVSVLQPDTTALATIAAASAPSVQSVTQPSPALGSSPTAQPSSGTSDASSITMANAPDLLARMLVRAAGADAAVNAGAATTSNDTGTPLTAAALAARFASAIAEAANGSTGTSGGQTSGNWSDHGFDNGNQSATPSTSNSNTTTNVAATPSTVVAQTQNTLQPQQSSAPAVDVNSVLEQMVKSMTMRTNAQGSSEIHLSLQPENLGTVTMRLTVTGSQITANVVAQNADVRSALISNHQQLARSLSNAGLTLSGFSVDVSGGDAKQRQQQNQGQAGLGRRYVVHELNGGTATSETATNAILGPPLNGGSGVALFNYLA